VSVSVSIAFDERGMCIKFVRRSTKHCLQYGRQVRESTNYKACCTCRNQVSDIYDGNQGKLLRIASVYSNVGREHASDAENCRGVQNTRVLYAVGCGFDSRTVWEKCFLI
jgi:hypothetical protein